MISTLRLLTQEGRRQKAEGRREENRREEGFYVQFFRSFQLLNYFCLGVLVTSCLLVLSLSMASAALAERGARDDDAPRGNTTSTGTRGGCENSNQGELTVLAPTKEGKTASVRPTFAWFVADKKPFQMELNIYELNGNEKDKLVERINLTSSLGINKVSLSENKLGLTVGKKYFWQVVILCDPNHPSTAITTQATFEVVEMPPALKSALSTAKEPAQIAKLYAQYNLWYDAFGEALRYEQNSRAKQMTNNLLNELAKIEETHQGQKLRNIANNQ